MGEPEVRGRYMATFLSHVDALAEGATIRAAIDAERLAVIERSSSFFDWLPVSDNLLATRAVADVLGPRRTHDFFAWEIVEVGESTATLEMVDVPDVMTRDAAWLASVGSSLHAIFRVADVDGAVTLAAERARPRYKFRWT